MWFKYNAYPDPIAVSGDGLQQPILFIRFLRRISLPIQSFVGILSTSLIRSILPNDPPVGLVRRGGPE